jgi:hypothetical protein
VVDHPNAICTEIEIEDVGTARVPNMWQYARIKHMAPGPNREIAPFAAAVCMTLKHSRSCRSTSNARLCAAYYHLTSPGQFGNGRGTHDRLQTSLSSPRLPKAGIHVRPRRLYGPGSER